MRGSDLSPRRERDVRSGRRPDDDRGASALEFALVASILMLLLLAIVELARFVSMTSGAETASREAARYGSAVGDTEGGIPRYADCSRIRQAGQRLSGLSGLRAGDIAVSYDAGPGTATTTSCSGASIDPNTVASGDRIVVTVTTTFDSIVPFLDGAPISSTDRRTIFK